MLLMKLQIGLCDSVRVGHIVADGRSGPSVCAGAVFLCPADRSVNRDVRDVDALRHQFPCHALRRVRTWHGMPLQRRRSRGSL